MTTTKSRARSASSRWRLLVLTLLLAGCGPEAGEPKAAEPFDDTLVAPAAARGHFTTDTSATQVIYINFDGGRVADCSGYCSDAPNNRSWAIGEVWGKSAVDFAPFGRGKATIVAAVEAAFSPYNVLVTTSRPAVGPYTMLVISSTAGPHHGVAPLDCGNGNKSDIAFVYSIGDNSVGFIARASVHELGHSFGLSHVVSTADYMQWASRGDDFTTSTYDASHGSGKCTTAATQDAPAQLMAALGPHAFSGTFADDDGNIHEAAIEAIAKAGITKGCSAGPPPRYCPNDPVTRGQMAVFLQRAFSLPTSGKNHFDDDDGAWYEAAANALADSGITYGCGSRKYCGADVVTRGQMAAFLTRALGLPKAAMDYFDDDAGRFYEQSANSVAQAGVTKGCGVRKYCGEAPVTRGQMASFLARALKLL